MIEFIAEEGCTIGAESTHLNRILSHGYGGSEDQQKRHKENDAACRQQDAAQPVGFHQIFGVQRVVLWRFRVRHECSLKRED